MRPLKAARPGLVREDEFLALPESMERVELLDGEVIVSPSPERWHQQLVLRLGNHLTRWAESRSEPLFVGLSPLDVRFAPGRILQPDLFVILGRVSLDERGPIDRVPDLCIEVVSTNRVYDRLTKRLVYAAAGVREYWVVETERVIERWHGPGPGPGLALAEELVETLVSPILPGFRLDVRALYAR